MDESEHSVRAEVISQLLHERWGPLGAGGIQLLGARISGILDVDNITSKSGLHLVKCVFDHEIKAFDSHLSVLNLSGSLLPALFADRINLSGRLIMQETRIDADNEYGGLRLAGARILGQVVLEKARIANFSGPAIHGDRMQVGGSVLMRRARIISTSTRGAVRLSSSKVSGTVMLDNSAVFSVDGPALTLYQAEIEADLRIESSHISASADNCAINLYGCNIRGELLLEQSTVLCADGSALNGPGLHVDKGVSIIGSTLACASKLSTVELGGARIGGQVSISRTESLNSRGPAIDVEGIRVEDDFDLLHVLVSGIGKRGVVRIPGARVGGRIDMTGLQASNSSGPAVSGDALRVGDGLILDDVKIFSRSENSAIRLVGAQIGGDLSVQRAVVVNQKGPAIMGDRIRVDANFTVDGSRLATRSNQGCFRIIGGQVGGQLSLEALEFRNPNGILIDLENAKTDMLFLVKGTICSHQKPRFGHPCAREKRIDVASFRFSGLARVSWSDWLHILRYHTSGYEPQPYQHLASVERNLGHDGNARKILIAQQQDRHKRAGSTIGGRWSRGFHRAWGWLAGYGYRVRHTAVALLIMLILACSLGFFAGQVVAHSGHRVAERTASFDARVGRNCSTIELIGLGLDRGLPLSPTGIRARCDINTGTMWGQIITGAMWLIQGIVWGLATLALAGYTSLIRKVG